MNTAISKKKMKSCLKMFNAGGRVNYDRAKKICAKMLRYNDSSHAAPHSRIKVCKKSDPAVRRIMGSLASLRMAGARGDGSGAEDRYYYDVESIKQSLRSRCGPKFVNKVMKSVRKMEY